MNVTLFLPELACLCAAILLLLYMFLHPGLRTKRDETDLGDDDGEPPSEPPVVGPVPLRPTAPPPSTGEGPGGPTEVAGP